ncbi:hypothetical protein, partial [Pseudomonas alloputida]|uniref:hypothetical protein n=1 Tax=Pseudomonas alloputida TaxID=1940621 RepID=UPI001E4854D4
GSRKKSGAQHRESGGRLECGDDGSLTVIEPSTEALVLTLKHISSSIAQHKAASDTEVRRTSASQAMELKKLYMTLKDGDAVGRKLIK